MGCVTYKPITKTLKKLISQPVRGFRPVYRAPGAYERIPNLGKNTVGLAVAIVDGAAPLKTSKTYHT